ncbi:hypothetical protein BDW22DRAFT_112554 [Trametopsis cervina]|nr:hypothetical protein BDW22DRAFT_112554 [Trametopsis cervina]
MSLSPSTSMLIPTPSRSSDFMTGTASAPAFSTPDPFTDETALENRSASEIFNPPLSRTTVPAHSTSHSTATPNAVEIDLHTTIIIPNYEIYYGTNISSFKPNYHALGDGSLVATPFIADISSANVQLACTSALAAFFCVTSWITVQYIRHGKIKRKGLFYVLLCSQLLGLAAMLIFIVPSFNQSVDCHVMTTIVVIFVGISYSLMMTGILGFKAYRCLNSSRLVLVAIAVLRMALLGLLVAEVIELTPHRRLSGGCLTSFTTIFSSAIIVLQTVESAFISGCFLLAMWRSSRSSIVQGRLSISVSVRDPPEIRIMDGLEALQDRTEQMPRGWWDYVPSGPHSEVPVDEKTHDRPATTLTRDTSMATSRAGTRPHNSVIPENNGRSWHPQSYGPAQRHGRPISPSPGSVRSRLSRYMPRMQLFRQVVKNELAYTVFSTILSLVTGLLSILGMSTTTFMDSAGWVCVNWLLLSIFSMGSFGRVVRRHERDALLQHPAAWDLMYRAELEASRAFASGRTRRPYSPISVVSRTPHRAPTFSNPFSDAYSVPSQGGASRNSSTRHSQRPRAMRTPSLPRIPVPLRKTDSFSSTSSLLSPSSPTASVSTADSAMRRLPQPLLYETRGSPTIHPSPTSEFPSFGSFSSASTPIEHRGLTSHATEASYPKITTLDSKMASGLSILPENWIPYEMAFEKPI